MKSNRHFPGFEIENEIVTIYKKVMEGIEIQVTPLISGWSILFSIGHLVLTENQSDRCNSSDFSFTKSYLAKWDWIEFYVYVGDDMDLDTCITLTGKKRIIVATGVVDFKCCKKFVNEHLECFITEVYPPIMADLASPKLAS